MSDLGMWMKTCGCNRPSIHWSSDFNQRICMNCGTIMDNDDKTIPFIHLHVHTHLSLMRAICKTEDIISKTKEYGMSAVAKTEYGNMFGVPAFVKDCTDAGIKPIVGVEFDTVFTDKTKIPITYIALNHAGYKNLVRLTTIAWCERKQKDDPFVLLSDVVGDGLVALFGDINNYASVTSITIPSLQSKIETFIEIVYHSEEVDTSRITIAQALAKEHNLPIVATNNVHYTNKEDHDVFKIANKIGKRESTIYKPEYYFKSPEEMASSGLYLEWLENSVRIADRVEDYKIINKDPIIPTFKNKHGEWSIEQAHAKLEMEAWTGLSSKGLLNNKIYVDRLQYELGVIKDKKFSSYFLIISDIIEFMKRSGMLRPYGRGSSVGSLVCYCLDITAMDPIEWGVPFERFINYGRIDLPDIDTDITQEGRPAVLKYIADTHGHDRVAQIATFQTLALKASISDVGRALDVPYTQNIDVRNKIPDEITTMEEVPGEIKKAMSSVPGWVDYAMALNGIAKHSGYHAAGVVISNRPLGDLVPLMPEDGGLCGIQYDMRDIEILGLLKLDMLGLKTLDIIEHTLNRVKAQYNVDIDIYNLPSDDAETYKTISGGDYVSVFQLDSPGYRKLCRKLQPQNFDHMMALNALYRPGPLEGGMTDEYVERKHGRQSLTGWHPWLDKVLSRTYQAPIFQEQVLDIAKIIAGFDDVEADKYRKAIGKKDKEKFDAAQKKFKDNALKMTGLVPPNTFNGTLENWIDDLLHRLAGYARYGWNCLSANTLITTCSRGLIPIKDIKIGEEVWSVREQTGDIFRNRVVDVINNGVRSVMRITTNNGRSIICTPNHRFLSTKQSYIYASELVVGDELNIFQNRVSRTNLNIDMASIINNNKVPIGITKNNIIWNNMVNLESIRRSTKHTSIFVSVKDAFSFIAFYFFAFIISAFNKHSAASNKFINTLGSNFYSFIRQDFSNSSLASDSGLINKCNLIFNVWRNCINFITPETPLSQMPRQRGWSSFKWKIIQYIFTTVTSLMEFAYSAFIFIIFILFKITPIAKLFTNTPFTNGYFFATSGTIGGLGVFPFSAFITKSSNDIGFSNKHIITGGAQNFNIHNKILNDWNVPVILMEKISDIEYLNDSIEVWDLTMEQNPNFVANGILVHNSGHAAGYGRITYITAYLETHYPYEYYAALLDSASTPLKKASLMRGILHKKIKIIPPHINYSGSEFEINNKVIYMGLSSIRSCGKSVDDIIVERNKNGQFSSFVEFCQRLPSINKTIKTNIIKSGAFSWDKILTDRNKIDNIENIHKIVKKKNKNFDGSKIPSVQILMNCFIDGVEYTDIQRQNNEQEVLNSFITGHPAAIYQRLYLHFEKGGTQVVCPSALPELEEGISVLLIGMVDSVRKKATVHGKNPGTPYLSIVMSDNESSTLFNIWYPLCNDMEKILVEKQVAMLQATTRKDKFKENVMSIQPNTGVMLTNGVPIQGVFSAIDEDPAILVSKIGGIVENVTTMSDKKYASIRGGAIAVMPDILENVVNEHPQARFLLHM